MSLQTQSNPQRFYIADQMKGFSLYDLIHQNISTIPPKEKEENKNEINPN